MSDVPKPPQDWDSVRAGSAEGAVLLAWFATAIAVAIGYTIFAAFF